MDTASMIFGSALMAVILLACPFTEPQAQPPQPPSKYTPPTAHNSSNISNASANTSAEKAELDWARINRGSVENACLSQAKKAAVASGYSAGMVYTCSCAAQESGVARSYDCSVSALDGAHPVGITCTKGSRTCGISSEQGNFTYTFDQLQALAGP